MSCSCGPGRENGISNHSDQRNNMTQETAAQGRTRSQTTLSAMLRSLGFTLQNMGNQTRVLSRDCFAVLRLLSGLDHHSSSPVQSGFQENGGKESKLREMKSSQEPAAKLQRRDNKVKE